jgi:hypothetical protein
MPPKNENEYQQDDRSKEGVYLHGYRGYWRRTGLDENDVTAECDERDDRRPKIKPYVRPLPWRTENLRQLCPMNALRDGSADDQVRPVAPEQNRAEASSGVYATDVLLVGQGNLLQVRAAAVRAPQLHRLASWRPRRMNMSLPLYCVSQCWVVPVLNSGIHELPPALSGAHPSIQFATDVLAPYPGRRWRTTGHFSGDEQQQMLVIFAHTAHVLSKLFEQPDPILSTLSHVSVRRNLDGRLHCLSGIVAVVKQPMTAQERLDPETVIKSIYFLCIPF